MTYNVTMNIEVRDVEAESPEAAIAWVKEVLKGSDLESDVRTYSEQAEEE